MTKEKVDRRGYVKYAAAGVIVIAGAAAGGYYASRPTGPVVKETVTATEVKTIKEEAEEPTGPFKPALPGEKYTWEEKQADYYQEIDPACERLHFWSDWACYSSPVIEASFLGETGIKEVATDVYTDEMDVFAKSVAGGHGYDILHIHFVTDPNNMDRLGPWRQYQKDHPENPLLEPLDMKIMSNYGEMYPSLEFWEKAIKWDGEVYCVPQELFQNSVTYNTNYVSEDEGSSYAALWNPKFKNKISMPAYGVEAIMVAGIYTGADVAWNQTPEEIERSKKALIDQRPLVRAYWGTAGDYETMLASEEIHIGYSWWACVQKLVKQGFPVAFADVEEGMIIGACHHGISTESKFKYETNLWLNYNLSAYRGARLMSACAHPPVAKSAYKDESVFTPDIMDYWRLGILEKQWSKGHYYSIPDNVDLYLKAWAEVQAA
jgi:spermidine/putrescine-binding protein